MNRRDFIKTLAMAAPATQMALAHSVAGTTDPMNVLFIAVDDHSAGPHAVRNLAGSPEHAALVADLSTRLQPFVKAR